MWPLLGPCHMSEVLHRWVLASRMLWMSYTSRWMARIRGSYSFFFSPPAFPIWTEFFAHTLIWRYLVYQGHPSNYVSASSKTCAWKFISVSVLPVCVSVCVVCITLQAACLWKFISVSICVPMTSTPLHTRPGRESWPTSAAGVAQVRGRT